MATSGRESVAEDFQHPHRQADQNGFRFRDSLEMTFFKFTFLVAIAVAPTLRAEAGTPGVVRVQLQGQHLLVVAKFPSQGGAHLLLSLIHI